MSDEYQLTKEEIQSVKNIHDAVRNSFMSIALFTLCVIAAAAYTALKQWVNSNPSLGFGLIALFGTPTAFGLIGWYLFCHMDNFKKLLFRSSIAGVIIGIAGFCYFYFIY